MTQFNRGFRFSTFAAALAVVGALAGCSDSPPERAGTVNESSSDAADQGADSKEAEGNKVELDAVGRELTNEQAEAALPAVSALPTGWSVDPENTLTDESDEDSEATIEPAKCQAIMDDLGDEQDDEPTGKASRTYTAGMLGPFMGVEISSYADEVPDDVFKKTLGALSSCPEIKSTENGETMTFKTSSLSFPNLGEESAAIRMAATTGDIPVGLDFVFIRAGHTIVTLSHATVGAGSGSADALEKTARETVANLEKG